MDDRELIAMAIYGSGLVTGGRAFHVAERGRKKQAYLMADAALAALGDRLLPELHEDVVEVRAYLRAITNRWDADAYHADDEEDARWTGSGPTIAAAIRSALSQTGERETA